MSYANNHSVVLIVAAACAMTGPSSPVGAQCQKWLEGPLNVAVPFSAAYTMLQWDPDGGGPLSPLLLGGGSGGVYAWDGVNWRIHGSGQLTDVRALAIHNGELIAAGEFEITSGTFTHVVRWNGSGWSALGGNVGNHVHAEVRALASFGGELFAAGDFDDAGGVAVNNIARWNGSSWLAVADGLSGDINGLVVFDDDANGPNPPALYAAGTFPDFSELGLLTSVARWNGVAWTSVGPVHTPAQHAEGLSLCVFNSQLHLGTGPYTPLSVPRCEVRRWTGSGWIVVGALQGGAYPDQTRINSLLALNGQLFVAGAFSTLIQPTTLALTHVAWWNSVSWQPLGSGWPTNSTDAAQSLAAFNGALVAGGAVTRPAAWNGTIWSLVDPPSSAHALTTFGTKLAFGGQFSRGTSPNFLYNVGVWDGQQLQSLGSGTNGVVRAMKSMTTSPTITSLVVGGDFSKAGGLTMNRVARWDQSSTNPLQTGWFSMGSGFNGNVHALEFGYQGVLIAAGEFTAPGPPAINRMARWSTTLNQWLPFATANGSDMNNTVRAVKVYAVSPQNPLANVVTVAGGDFTTANGVAVNRIAQWIDNAQFGSTPWAAMGTGFNNSVYAIERHSGSIYAGGAFTADGSNSVALSRCARWTGTTWVPVGNGQGFNGTVHAIKSIGGLLYVSGDFTSVDGLPAYRIARWNGAIWEAITGSQTPGPMRALLAYNNEVIVGGDYQAVYPPTRGPVVSPGVARFTQAGVPWIAQQPSPTTVQCSAAATFSVTIPIGYSPSYQWRRNSVPLVNGPTAWGSVIGGALGDDLFIGSAKPSDAGSYDCVITSTCGSVTTLAVMLAVAGNCCPADIAPPDGAGNFGDGVVNVTDLLAVITAWGACGGVCPADINGDSIVNVTDLLIVITNWGPCS